MLQNNSFSAKNVELYKKVNSSSSKIGEIEEDNNKGSIDKINELSFSEQEFNQNELYPFEEKSSITEHNKSELSFSEDHHLNNFNFIEAYKKQFYPNFEEHQNTMLRKTEETSKDTTKRKRRRDKNKEKEISKKDDNEEA